MTISKLAFILLIFSLIFVSITAGFFVQNNLQNEEHLTANTSFSTQNTEQIKQNAGIILTGQMEAISSQASESLANSVNSQNSNSDSSSSSNSSKNSSDNLDNPNLEKPVFTYKSYKAKLEQIVKEQNPKIALNQLNEDIYKVKTAQENCHSLTHAVGNFALEKYNNNVAKAVEFYVDICGGGYMHGVVEHYLELNPNAEEDILNLCPDGKDGICFHAIGHGFMLMKNYNIPNSVQSCQKLVDLAQQTWCGEGVFMENFDSENAPDSSKLFLDPQNPFGICNNYANPYNETCYYYAARYVFKINKDAQSSLQKCLELAGFADTCVRGMSAGILRSDLFHPEKMEIFCAFVPKNRLSCYQGAINYYLLMLEQKTKAHDQICNQMQNPENQKLCTEVVNKSIFGK